MAFSYWIRLYKVSLSVCELSVHNCKKNFDLKSIQSASEQNGFNSYESRKGER